MFTHLHLHTGYSLLDSSIQISQAINTAKTLGMKSMAITDHGAMYGVIDFYKEAAENGINPIIGCEVYTTPNYLDKTPKNRRSNHLILLCENNEGYSNLIKIVSLGWVKGFYGKPRVDNSVLKEFHTGLICLSACIQGIIPQKILQKDYSGALAEAKALQEIFGKDNFFIEIQNHRLKEELSVLPHLIKIAKKIDAPLVATNDCHYLTGSKEDYETHEVLLCSQQKKTLSDPNRMTFSTNEFYIKSEDEMLQTFSSFAEGKEACRNTELIAQRCHVSFEFGNIKLPYFDIPKNEISHLSYFTHLCYQGLETRYGKNYDAKLKKRLNYEIDIINKKGFISYYLIVWDYVCFAKNSGIPVGPGRGSGAGSLAAYCIGITDIDPIKYGLLFERFLNPERPSMPDFDIDFGNLRRHEVLDYAVQKYGKPQVSRIIDFSFLKPKSAFNDVCRVFDVPPSISRKISKMIPTTSLTLTDALSDSPDFNNIYTKSQKYDFKHIIDIAIKLQGLPRHSSAHACGILITDKPISNYAPLCLSSKDADDDIDSLNDSDNNSSKKDEKVVVVQFQGHTLEELGLVKMDFLGLRNLTAIQNCEKSIKKNINSDFDIKKIDEHDHKTFEMMGKGQTDVVFQFESAGMKNILMQMKPKSIDDLTAFISLYRPGPMKSIPTYIHNAHSPNDVTYDDPRLKPILEETYGCLVYQEQIMKMFQTLAGYSLGRADIVRRAMGKKKKKVMDEERKIFVHGKTENGKVIVEGALARGVSEETALRLMQKTESFASYAFNKSHAAAYADLAYKTAFLKCHYPVEFVSEMINVFIDNQKKLAAYCNLAKNTLKIDILPPNINISEELFTYSHTKIRFGLAGVKGVGTKASKSIVKERTLHGKFSSFFDIVKRLSPLVSSSTLESLIYAGAFDNFGLNRNEMISNLKRTTDFIKKGNKENLEGQISLFSEKQSEPDIIKTPEMPIKQKLANELAMLSIFISQDPLSIYSSAMAKLDLSSSYFIRLQAAVEENPDSFVTARPIVCVCILFSVEKKFSKAGNAYAKGFVQDSSGREPLFIPQKTLNKSPETIFEDGAAVLLFASAALSDNDELSVTANDIFLLPENPTTSSNNSISYNSFFKIPTIYNYLKRKKQKISSSKVQSKSSNFTEIMTQSQIMYGVHCYSNCPDINTLLDNAHSICMQMVGDYPIYFHFLPTNQIFKSKNSVSMQNQNLICSLWSLFPTIKMTYMDF